MTTNTRNKTGYQVIPERAVIHPVAKLIPIFPSSDMVKRMLIAVPGWDLNKSPVWPVMTGNVEARPIPRMITAG